MMHDLVARFGLPILAGLLAIQPAAADIGTPAGVAGAVSGSVGLTSPAKQITAPVAVSSGDGIVMGDSLATAGESRLQVMLLDESAITLGPDAELTIDEFVFDPANTNQNALAASLLKGTFRLVTGGVARQNPEGTTLNLPNAVLTIRGTTILGSCAATCVVALAGSGEANSAAKKSSTATLKTAKGEVTLKRPGFYVEIAEDGTISPPERLNNATEQRFANLFPTEDALGKAIPGKTASQFTPLANGLLNASGQPTQEARPLALNQREFDVADPFTGNDAFDGTTNLQNQVIRFSTGGETLNMGLYGSFGVDYTLDLGKRDFGGVLSFTDVDYGNGSGSLPFTIDPFTNGFTQTESGPVANTAANDTMTVQYTIGKNGFDVGINYLANPTATPQTGSGTAPVVP